MKIAVSSTGPSLDAPMDERFGRCPCFVIADSAGSDVDPVNNPCATQGHGAGIQAARLVAETGGRGCPDGPLRSERLRHPGRGGCFSRDRVRRHGEGCPREVPGRKRRWSRPRVTDREREYDANRYRQRQGRNG